MPFRFASARAREPFNSPPRSLILSGIMMRDAGLSVNAQPPARMWRPKPATVIGAMVLAAIVYLHWQGRVWWCACGQPYPVSLRVNSLHNSQHLMDAYSLSHVLHGVLFFGLFWLFG